MNAITSIIPGPITATVGNKILKNAPLIFNNRFSTIICEMLQNARRAGATRIEITTAKSASNAGLITITDNGHGIKPENFSTLLKFGQSGWDNLTEAVETPAGMGIFSLAKRNPTIASNGFEVTLPPSVFTASENANIVPSETTTGTKITFDLIPEDFRGELAPSWINKPKPIVTSDFPHRYNYDNHMETWELSIRKEAHFNDMEISLNGEILHRQTFGEKAIATVKESGATIYIYSRSAFTNAPNSDYVPEYGMANFFGHLIPEDHFRMNIIDRADSSNHPHHKPRQLEPLHLISEQTEYYFGVNIENTSGLTPKLPDRLELHQNDAIKRIVCAAKREIYRIIARNPYNKITFGEYQEALSFGISIPKPVETLTRHNKKAGTFVSRTTQVFYDRNKKLPDNGHIYISETMLNAENMAVGNMIESAIEKILDKKEDEAYAIYAIPSDLPNNDLVSTGIALAITDNYGNIHETTITDFDKYSFRDEESDYNLLLTGIKASAGAHVEQIKIAFINNKKKTVLAGNIPFLMTAMQDELYFPDEDTILFDKTVTETKTAFLMIKTCTFDYEHYERTRYGSCDEQDTDEGEELFDNDLENYIVENISPKGEVPALFAERMKEVIRDGFFEIPRAISSEIGQFTITAKKDEQGLLSISLETINSFGKKDAF